MNRRLLHSALLPLLLLAGCSTSALHQARTQFYAGNNTAALATLTNSSVVSSQDRLLYWLEKGLILHEEGDYEASARELLNAAEYLVDNDYISVSDQARTLLANDWAARYPGEYTERLWVHSYLMMNFLALGKYDSAAVEARRALERIDSKSELLKQDTFTRALIALSFETAGQLNDAYIEYRKLGDQTNNPPQLDQLLLEQANRLGFAKDARDITQRLHDNGVSLTRTPSDSAAEAIVFVSAGYIPRKTSGTLVTSHDSRIAFPQYYLSQSQSPMLYGRVDGVRCDCLQVTTDLGQLVNESLKERAARVAAKTIIRAVSKESVADAIGEKDEFAGELARLIFFALEEADTRSWQSLPRHLSLLRVPLPTDDSAITLSLSRSDTNTHSAIDRTMQVLLQPDNRVDSKKEPTDLLPSTHGRFRFYRYRVPR